MAASTTIFLPVVVMVADHHCRRHGSISRWFSLLIASSITTFIFIYSLITIIEVSISPKPPIFEINSLSISNFTVSDTTLAANWNASFKIQNPNLVLGFSLDRIDGTVFYKNKAALSMGSVEGFNLDSNEKKIVSIRFATTGLEGDQPIVEYPVLREIAKDRERGTVRFGVRLSVRGSFKGKVLWWWWSRAVAVNPYCFDLNLNVGVTVDDLGRENGGLILLNEPRICPIVVMFLD